MTHKFTITITPVDDEIPLVINNGLTVQEGVRKLITEFELKALDKDTEVRDYKKEGCQITGRIKVWELIAFLNGTKHLLTFLKQELSTLRSRINIICYDFVSYALLITYR